MRCSRWSGSSARRSSTNSSPRSSSADRGAGRLGAAESELLSRINRGFPEGLRERYDELIDRRRDESLTPEEHQELLRLTAEAERIEGDRLSALADLTRIRGIPLRALMDELGIPAPSDG